MNDMIAINGLSALAFPQTYLAGNFVRESLLFFERLLLYQPCEGPAKVNFDLLREKKLVTGYAPLPLGEDYGLFLQVIKDLKAHKDEYHAAYMQSLNLDGLKDQDETSTWSLRAKLLKVGTPQTFREQKSLWEERIFLRLAEILDEEDEEVRRQLLTVGVREAQLIKNLAGEDELEEELHQYNSMGMEDTTSSFGLEQRVKYWGRLFLADPQKSDHFVLLTNQKEAQLILADIADKFFKRTSIPVLSLTLPFIETMEDADFVARHEAFRRSAQTIITAIETDLLALASGKKTHPTEYPNDQTSQERSTRFTQLITDSFPTHPDKRGMLTFFLYPDITLSALFSCTCAPVRLPHAVSHGYPHSLIAVLE